MTPHMIANNWLLSYATIEGISIILAQMNVRTKRLSKMDKAVIDLEAYYSEFETEFTFFFKDLIDFSNNKRNELLAQ
jgi:acyl carrier protein phosphodiesterase